MALGKHRRVRDTLALKSYVREHTFLQRRRPDGKRTRGKRLDILGIGETQIRTTVRPHLTPVGMAPINKSGNDRGW